MQDANILHVGWLRDLMKLSEPPMPSFGRLAETCLEHGDWPAELELQPRSLATLFSKLDREIDLDWLRDRVEVQRVIARVLGRPLGDVRVALGEAPALVHGRRLRLADARYARELDLGREALPPGIPERAIAPDTWGHVYWVAPAGAGKSLVGAWLTARGLARVLHVEHAGDWPELLPGGALFIELGRGVHLPAPMHKALLARTTPVCVASANLDVPEGFTTFHSPPIAAYLRPLADWLAERFDDTGHFSAARAETWLRQVALPHRAVLGFGEVLGLLGATDEFPPQSLKGKSLDDLGRAFVERRLADALLDTSWGPAVSSRAFAALELAAARALVEPELDLAAPRTLEVWADLLAGSSETPDEEWFVRAMRLEDDRTARPSQVARAARRLPPSGYRMARSLSLGGLLTSPQSGDVRSDVELTLGPRWLVSLLAARANGAALAMSPSEWGSALLDPAKRGELEAALHARLQRGHYSALETLIDQLDPAEPSHLAALDASLRKLAEVELTGEQLPDDLKTDVLGAACDALVCIEDTLEPTLALAGAPAHRAAIAALSENHPLPERRLDPHRTEQTELREALARDCATVASSAGRELGVAWLLLARTLYRGRMHGAPRALRFIELLLADARARPQEDHASHADDPRALALEVRDVLGDELELVLRVAIRLGGESVLERAWHLLTDPQLASLRDPDLLRRLWLRVRPERLPELHTRGVAVEFASLLPHHYVAWLQSDTPLPGVAAPHCPLEAAHAAIRERGPSCVDPDALERLLERSPRLLAILVERLSGPASGTDTPQLLRLSAPALTHLIEALPEDAALLRWPRAALDCIRRLLLARIALFGPRVDVATFRLRSLELALGPLRRMRGA